MAELYPIIEVKFDPNDDECKIIEENPMDMSADDFLNAWMEDRSQVPEGLYYFEDMLGLYVVIDNKTGSGHMWTFETHEDCRNRLEIVEFQYRRDQKKKPAFGSDIWNTKATIRSGYKSLRQICTEHGWLNASSIEDMTKIMMANDCGWPIDHIATMIWMGTDYRKDFSDSIDFENAGEQRREILTVLTQARDRMLYNDKCCDRLDQIEEAAKHVSEHVKTETANKSQPKRGLKR